MIHHCVWLRFRAEVTRQERDALIAEITALVHVIPGLVAVHSGMNARLEELDHGFSEGFIAVFSDREALAVYQNHPQHQAAGRRLIAAVQGGLQGLLVFDLEQVTGTAFVNHRHD